MTGPLIVDLQGLTLTAEERDILAHPLVGGVILFARNFASAQQISELCRAIRETRDTPLLITVDQEGGRVQRFKQEFTVLPAMGKIGHHYDTDPNEALALVESCGWLIAQELLAVGIDFSFAPVLDLNKNQNTVIGDRAFHHNPDIVITLAKHIFLTLQKNGMAACGKHFPGHGHVALDSHHDFPIDSRSLTEVMRTDLQPFVALIQQGIPALMPAHIVFPAIAPEAVGFSPFWLQHILRQQYQFSGLIISDDLTMKAAESAGDYVDRVKTALASGCDMVLICNHQAGVIDVLDHVGEVPLPALEKFKRMQGKFTRNWQELTNSKQWQHCKKHIKENYDYYKN